MVKPKLVKELRDDLRKDAESGITLNEENTKIWYVMPLLRALGYDDIDITFDIPLELSPSIGIDTFISIRDTPVMIADCKKRDTDLNDDKLIQKLGERFSIAAMEHGLKVAALTNGDDYYFFTYAKDSIEMDREPFCRISITRSSIREVIKQLDRFSKQKIMEINLNIETKEQTTSCDSTGEKQDSEVVTGCLSENIERIRNMVNVASVKVIQGRLSEAAKINKEVNEENTKSWYVVPLLRALGYDDTDLEYEVPMKSRADLRLDIRASAHDKPVMLIECKKRGLNLNDDRFIRQLRGYFTDSITENGARNSAKLAILTNGDDYYFYTDTAEQNVMDKEPYLKIKITELKDSEVIEERLDRYSIDNILKINLKDDAREQRVRMECERIASGLVSGRVPDYIVESVIKEVGIDKQDIGIEKAKGILHKSITTAFRSTVGVDTVVDTEDKPKAGTKKAPKEKKADAKKSGGAKSTESKSGDKTQTSADTKSETKEQVKPQESDSGRQEKAGIRDKSKASNIKLNHEYIFNDYSDGNWYYHTLGYAVIAGTVYTEVSFAQAYAETVRYVLDNKPEVLNQLLERGKRFATYSKLESTQFWKKVEGHDIGLYTKLDVGAIVKLIKVVLSIAEYPDDTVKFSFKE